MDSGKWDSHEIKQPGYSTPQIKLKRSRQFGSNSSTLDSCVPAYATLPRNRANVSSRRSRNMIPSSPAHSPHHSPGRVFGSESASRTLPKQGSETASRTLPKQGSETASRTLPKQPRNISSPVQIRVQSEPDELQPVSVTISTTPCMKVHRISKEEQVAKQEERRRRKNEYFQKTPTNKLKITQRDLEAYVVFYEKKLAAIVQSMDLNIAVEQKKKDRLEARLKYLLDDNDTLSMQLAGIRKDLKKCQSLTETPV